jgi:osmotically-inducible protein OsmY
VKKTENSMKRSKLRSSGCAALIVLASMVASVQAGESMAASSASAPGATRKENRALRKLVYAAFARDKSIDAGDIGVGAKDGAVTLTGAVDNAAQIEKAAALAGGVAGVTSVTNKLTVKRSFGQ